MLVDEPRVKWSAVARHHSHPSVLVLEEEMASMGAHQFESELVQGFDNLPDLRRSGAKDSLWKSNPELLNAHELRSPSRLRHRYANCVAQVDVFVCGRRAPSSPSGITKDISLRRPDCERITFGGEEPSRANPADGDRISYHPGPLRRREAWDLRPGKGFSEVLP
jgi:hypothetical protein